MACCSAWTTKRIPPQKGKTVVVTGANSGIGFHTALELARAGARVILAVRDARRGKEAVDKMLAELQSSNCSPQAFEVLQIDTSSLDSVRKFAAVLVARGVAIDTLINNAGIMMLPTRASSADGFELQMATNYLGHFALTCLLLPLLLKSADPRVVTVSSVVAWFSLPPFAAGDVDFKIECNYRPKHVYAKSKLYNLLFAIELSRRYPMIRSYAVHPGGSATNLHQHAFQHVMWLMQSAESGALPTLRAATCDRSVASGAYFGPRMLLFGSPTTATKPLAISMLSQRAGGLLWTASETATSVSGPRVVASKL